MTGRTYVVTDDSSLSEALAEAGADDRVVIAEGAYEVESEPVLVAVHGRWIALPFGTRTHCWIEGGQTKCIPVGRSVRLHERVRGAA